MNEVLNLAPIKRQVSAVVNNANALQIATSKDLVKAADIRTKIKEVGRIIKEAKDRIVKPLNEAKANAMNLFRPVENEWLEAERIVSGKMVDFNKKEEVRAAKETAKIEEKVEKGKMNMEEAAEKIEAVVPENKIEGKNGSVHFRMIKRVIIEDQNKLPREFLIPDIDKINKVAKSGIAIPGVKVEIDKIVASGRN